MLTTVEAPSGSLSIVAEELSRMISDGSLTRQVGRFVQPGALTATAPHPVYPVGLDDLAERFDVSDLQPAGWRYLLELDHEVVASIETTVDDDRHDFANLAIGPFVDGTANAVRDADARTGDDRYEFAVLHVPALHVMVLWLRGRSSEDDRFIPIEPSPLPGGGVYTRDEIAEELEAAARSAYAELRPDPSRDVDESGS